MEDASIVTPFGVPDGVGPGGNTSQVVFIGVPEKTLEILCRLRLDKVTGYICDSDMTKACAVISI